MENRGESSSLLTLNDIGNEVSSLRTETGKLFELDSKSGMGQYGLEARTGPIHFKETYADHEPWLELNESYCEPGEIKGIGRVLIYPRLPNIVTVYQDICGYQIQSRSNPDHVARVELVSIDGLPVTTWQDSAALKTSVRVHPYRVGIWKDFSAASKAKATTMRWRVTELGNAAKDSHPFAFRDSPEAYSTADLTALDPASMEQAKIAIETARTRIDDHSWYWDEIIPVEAKLVDTDWQTVNGYDDGWASDPGQFNRNEDMMHFGRSNVVGGSMMNFHRYTNIAIPFKSTINSASLTYVSHETHLMNSVYSNIYFNDVGNAVTPTSNADCLAKVTTTAYTAWDINSKWTQFATYVSGSLVNPLQEVINRADWASGNALMILHKNDGSSGDNWRSPCAYEEGSSRGSKLTATWTEPVDGPRGIYVPNVSWLSKSLLKRREI